jgi:uncharacterized HAD superfamily protein
MNIFIDVDNIIVDFESQFRKFLNKKTGKKLARENICEFEFYKSFGISKEQEIKFHNEFIMNEGYKKLKLIKGCKDGIKRLMKLGQIAFISARPEELRDITLEWFKKNKIPIRTDLLILAKDKISYSSQFDIAVEDKWEDAVRLAENSKIVILYDYPWNRKKDDNGNILRVENIIRVSNWEEIVESVEKIAEEKYKKEPTSDTFAIWKKSMDVQMHFNQLIMRNRITFASVLYAAFGAAFAFFKSGEIILKIKQKPFYMSDVIIAIAIIGLISYSLIDLSYYFKLLLGAVEFTEKMDKDYKKLGLTSSITKSIRHGKALWVLIIHYGIICLPLFVYIIARIFIK